MMTSSGSLEGFWYGFDGILMAFWSHFGVFLTGFLWDFVGF